MARIKEKIEDFGEKIGGAKKDYYKKNGIKVEDIKDLSHVQLINNTIKPHVMSKLNYEELVDGGLDRTLTYLIKTVYDSFPTKFSSTNNFEKDKEIASNYIKLGSSINEKLKNVKSIEDIRSIQGYLIDSNILIRRGTYSLGYSDDFKNIDLRKFYKALNVSRWDITKAERKVRDTNFPYKTEAWKKGLEINKYMNKQNNKIEYSIDSKSGYSYREIAKGFTSIQEAEKYMIEVIKKDYENQRKKKNQSIEVRPQLRHIERIGQNYRNSEDITTDDFLNKFKFRGGEFGNWNNQADRQQNLNLAFDSFLDLSKALGISPKAVSLDGSLGIAFGSRGSGRALAHYEPGAVVINLTKMKGAGSLAHEWGHALDDYYGRLSGDLRVNSFMSDAVNIKASKVPVVAKNFKTLMSSLKYKTLDEDELKEKYISAIEEVTETFEKSLRSLTKNYDTSDYKELKNPMMENREKEFKRLKKDLIKDGMYKERLENVFIRYNAELSNNYQKLKSIKDDVGKVEDYTDFYKFAKNLDDHRTKKYFSVDKELFARAFESYIENKIKSNNFKSDYLVYGTTGSPLYIVSDREKNLIFPNFDKLINSMKELDRSEVLQFEYKLTKEVYNNKDYKDKNVSPGNTKDEVSNESVVNTKDVNRLIDEENKLIIYQYEKDNSMVDIVKFDYDSMEFKGIEFNLEKEDLVKYSSDNVIDDLSNEADRILDLAKDKDKGLIDGIYSTVDNEKARILKSGLEDKYNMVLLTDKNKIIHYVNNVDKDNVITMLLKCGVKSIDNIDLNTSLNIDVDLFLFDEFKAAIDNHLDDKVFDLQLDDIKYEVIVEDNERFTIVNSSGEKDLVEKHELINKIMSSNEWKISENYDNSIEKYVEDLNNRTIDLIKELKTADNFKFKMDEGKELLVITNLEGEGYKIVSIIDGEAINHFKAETIEDAANKLAEEGFSVKDIKEKLNLKELEMSNYNKSIKFDIKGNITFDQIKNKGKIFVLRLDDKNLDKLKNLNQDFCTYKDKGANFTKVVVLQDEKNKALESLGLRNKEVGKVEYDEIKKLPGKNSYILVNKDEFRNLSNSNILFSAFVKGDQFNIIIKEKDVESTLKTIGRSYERTLGNTAYSEIKGQGAYKQLDNKIGIKTMEMLMENKLKFSAHYEGDSKLNIAFNKADTMKVNEIINKAKSEINKEIKERGR